MGKGPEHWFWGVAARQGLLFLLPFIIGVLYGTYLAFQEEGFIGMFSLQFWLMILLFTVVMILYLPLGLINVPAKLAGSSDMNDLANPLGDWFGSLILGWWIAYLWLAIMVYRGRAEITPRVKTYLIAALSLVLVSAVCLIVLESSGFRIMRIH